MMPHSIGQALGLIPLLSMFAGILMIAVGIILCVVPGTRPRGRSLTTYGAAICITAIFTASIIKSLASGRIERAIPQAIAGGIVFMLIVFLVRKRNMRRDDDEPPVSD